MIKHETQPKLEKPVVPQFVADYIDSEQKSCSTLSEALGNMYYEQRILDWFYINSETFAKAWLYGYEIEKEKLYTVEIPNPNYHDKGKFVLCKNKSGKVFMKWTCLDDWKFLEKFQLTEEEVKEKFDWAWEFAEVV